jgi:peptide/nickel transport system substrate-binding protein
MRVPSRAPAALLSLMLLAVLGATTLAGCSPSAAASTSGEASRGGAVTLVPSPKGPWIENFNPLISGDNSLPGTQGMIYETLLYFNRLDGSIHPWLASDYRWASDGTSVTFTIRPGVTWSDGQPLTSDDVVFTLNLAKQYPALDLNSLWKNIRGVSNPDPNTVVVTFTHPASQMLWYVGGQTYIVPKHIWQRAGDPTMAVVDHPVGTGPFTLKSFNAQLYVLGRNPRYWQAGKPFISELRYPAYTSNATADLMLSEGAVDWTGLFTPKIDQTFVDRDRAHNHYWFPPTNIVMLYLNTAKAPFNQDAVRLAISDAIDRQQISQTAEEGYEPVAHPSGLILPIEQRYLDAQYAPMAYTVDIAKSAALLEKAGFHKGADGVFVDASGKRLAFNINVPTGWTDWVTACQIMAQSLKAAGMDVRVNAVSFNQYISGLSQGTFDTAISWTNTGPTPYFLYYALLSSSNTAPVGSQATSNFERWNDPATDKLLAQYAGSIDPTVQQEALAGLQQIMVEHAPSIPLVYGATWYEYNTSRFVGWPDPAHPYAVPAPYGAMDAAVVAMNIHKP